MRRAPARRGVLLPIVAALIVIIAIGSFMIQRVSRQRYLEAHRYTFAEVAVNLAESGLNVALEHLRETSTTPGSLFHELLIEGAPGDLEGNSVLVSAGVLDRIAARVGDGADLQVTVELRGFSPAQPAGGDLRGLVPDPREKSGELAIVARGQYRGVVRSLVAAQRIQVVRVTAPVLSKFTLFLREKGGPEINLLRHDRASYGGALRLDDRPARPLVLYHREERFPAVVDGRFDSLRGIFGDMALDEGGLVYLGGADPWYLNLMHGAGDGTFEEGFHLRRTRYALDGALPGVAQEFGFYFGFYDGVLATPQFGAARSPPGSYPRPAGTGWVTPASSALRLYGDVQNVSPTVVLGPVYRSYLSLRLQDGLWYPFMTEDEFLASPFAADPRFVDGYGGYSRVMAQVVTEAYNRSADFIATNTETLVDGARVEAGETPFAPASELRGEALTRIGPAAAEDEAFLYPTPPQVASTSVTLRRVMDDGTPEELFRGALEDIDAELLREVLTKRATAIHAEAGEFLEAALHEGQLDSGGIAWVKARELELPALAVGGACMIVVDGSIVLRGGILPNAGGEPLTLVALDGDIRVETDQAVAAHLVALRGRVASRGTLEVLGGVAAESLDLAALVRGEGVKGIVYDEDLDPTREASYRKHFRVVLDETVRLTLEGH